MKKFLSILLVLIMMCSMILSACSSAPEISQGVENIIQTDDGNELNETQKDTQKNFESEELEEATSQEFVSQSTEDSVAVEDSANKINGTEAPAIDTSIKEDDEIADATNELEPEITPVVDKAELIDEIDEAEIIVAGNTADNYVADSWQAYQTALTDAKAVQNDKNATKEDIDKACAALQTAIDSLKLTVPTVTFGTYNVSGSKVSDATAIANEILQDTKGVSREIDVIGFQGLESEAQLTAIYNALKNSGYVSYKYFKGANGGVGFISKLPVKNPGAHNPKIITGPSGFKYGYVQLIVTADDGTQSLINFYVCSLSDIKSTRSNQISDIKSEIDKLNNSGKAYSKSNYFIAGNFGTSDYSEFGSIKNNLGIANKTYVTAKGDKGPWGTTIADANAKTNKNTVYPDGFLYHDDFWDLMVLSNGAFRRGTTNKTAEINKSHGLTHLLCYTEAIMIKFVPKTPSETESATSTQTEATVIETATETEVEKLQKGPSVTFATYNVSGSKFSDATAVANELLQDTKGNLRELDVIGLQGLENEAQLIAIYNALKDRGYISYKYFSGANGSIGFVSKIPVRNPNNYNPKTITGPGGFKYGYAQLLATDEHGNEYPINFYVCSLSATKDIRIGQIADIDAEIDKLNNIGTDYSKSNYFIAGYFGTSDYSEFGVIENNLGIANRTYVIGSANKGPWGTTVADANSKTNSNTDYPDGFLYHDEAWELNVLSNGAFRRGTTNKLADINKNHGLAHLLCFVEASLLVPANQASQETEIATDESGAYIDHTHSFGAWRTIKTEDCANEGEIERTCACGEKETKIIAAMGHKKVNDPAKAATCMESGITAGQHCSRCFEVLVAQEIIEALGHSVVKDPAIAATCTKLGLTEGQHCSRCDKVLVAQTVIAAKGHSVSGSSKAPTCTEYGWSAGGRCSACNASLGEETYLKPTGHTIVDHKCTNCSYQRIDFSNVDIYSSDYGYNYLGTLTNGAKMQTLYRRIETAVKDFHINNKTASKISVSCSDLKFKVSETYVQMAISRFIYDNPLYYWLVGGYTYSYSPSNNVISVINLTVVPEYVDGSVRAEYNSTIYEAAEEYYSVVENEESEYNITLAYYDMIIADINYAYESDGRTPQDDKWAHSVVGVFTKVGAVCEGYAKAFQLLLNVSDVENVYVTGMTTGPHAWNMVKLDDGKWYWFDVTADDAGGQFDDWVPGRGYFTVIDSTVNSYGQTFVDSHIPDIDYEWGWPSLPEVSKTEYDNKNILEALDTFVVGANTYQIVGYHKVHLIASTVKSGSFTIENIVLYDGELYEVVGTGTASSTGQIVFDPVFANRSVSEIIFSDNIVNIQGFQNCKTVTSVTISKNTENIIMYAFAYCTGLRTIKFDGTKAEWNAISKGTAWNRGCGTITVICTNGNVTA